MPFKEPINPIGDMNLRDGLFQRLYNALHRELASANARATPSTYADWIIGYHRESNWQYEHRDMWVGKVFSLWSKRGNIDVSLLLLLPFFNLKLKI